MTYRDSDEVFLPARAPQHAVPFGLPIRRSFAALPRVSSWLSRLSRQVLQLFITTLAWATGLGLVIGSIVLVAASTGPKHTVLGAQRDANSTARRQPSFATGKGAGAPHSARTHSAGAGDPDGSHVLATFSGHGNRTTAHFSVSASQAWQLQWAYRCSPQAGAAQFKLVRADALPGPDYFRTTTEDFAASGRGSAWLAATGQRIYLKVISACSWHVKVVQDV